jgi:hypothetical protein
MATADMQAISQKVDLLKSGWTPEKDCPEKLLPAFRQSKDAVYCLSIAASVYEIMRKNPGFAAPRYVPKFEPTLYLSKASGHADKAESLLKGEPKDSDFLDRQTRSLGESGSD